MRKGLPDPSAGTPPLPQGWVRGPVPAGNQQQGAKEVVLGYTEPVVGPPCVPPAVPLPYLGPIREVIMCFWCAEGVAVLT